MSETYISLYGDKSEAFRGVKEKIGPEGVTPSNPEVVMRLIEHYEATDAEIDGGLVQ
ncbi:hypothetical protein [Halorubrum sp. SD626R]|uniref:hypothetical protein n=1 Tax=Halorubrum sp. SD626R TaxID=1419722 RepID=UPI0013050DBE|nr:hypothetical protein [Halorubrum sp. SD626R]